MEIPPADYEKKEEKEGVGPFVGIIIIVGLLLAGGIYFLVTQELERRAAPTENQANLY
ncbi:MAG TPA: hypothetical protein VHD55_00140 [Candidatus Paceibacterota bacterium]|nr:hypothetical protein [Candidatus Paceibacterota bacterium]